jgi:hypothetical protein
MTKVQLIFEVHASGPVVWNVLVDPLYLSKLYPDVLSAEVEPPGRNFVGQKTHMIARAGRRRIEIYGETVELVTEKKIVSRNRPGGLFKSFESVIMLRPKGTGTEVMASFEYELSMGYLGRVFNVVMLERSVTDNLTAYSRNLKEFCELVPLPV